MQDQGSQDQGSNPQEPTPPAVEGWSVNHRTIREVPLSPHFKRQILSMGYLFKTHNQDTMPYISNAELTFPPRPDIFFFFFPFFKDTLSSEGLNLGTLWLLPMSLSHSFLNFPTGFLMGL